MYQVLFILGKSAESRILAPALDSTVLQKHPLNLRSEAKIFLKRCETLAAL